jgi:hypothetical protein
VKFQRTRGVLRLMAAVIHSVPNSAGAIPTRWFRNWTSDVPDDLDARLVVLGVDHA